MTYVADFIKILILNIGTIYLDFRILNKRQYYKKNIALLIIIELIINVLCLIVKNISSYTASIICLDILLTILFSVIAKNKVGNTEAAEKI